MVPISESSDDGYPAESSTLNPESQVPDDVEPGDKDNVSGTRTSPEEAVVLNTQQETKQHESTTDTSENAQPESYDPRGKISFKNITEKTTRSSIEKP
jgi:hypothetical protein